VTYTGKRMPTFVPPVIDRLVHRAMRNTIEPILEAHAFQDWVSGFGRVEAASRPYVRPPRTGSR
jgi:hypothetical protein